MIQGPSILYLLLRFWSRISHWSSRLGWLDSMLQRSIRLASLRTQMTSSQATPAFVLQVIWDSIQVLTLVWQQRYWTIFTGDQFLMKFSVTRSKRMHSVTHAHTDITELYLEWFKKLYSFPCKLSRKDRDNKHLHQGGWMKLLFENIFTSYTLKVEKRNEFEKLSHAKYDLKIMI